MIKTVVKHDDNYYYDVIRRNLKKYEQKRDALKICLEKWLI